MNRRKINMFLKAKHWQLFVFIFGIPFLLQIVMMGRLFSAFATNAPPEALLNMSSISLYPIFTSVSLMVLFAWIWSIGIGLQQKVPLHLKLKTRRFKFFFFFPAIYILLFMVFFSWFYLMIANQNTKPFPSINPKLISFILPFHLFSMFCIFYLFFFVAKTVKTIELQRKVKFEEFASEFFLIWFYPIGIWFIQPKINKIVAS